MTRDAIVESMTMMLGYFAAKHRAPRQEGEGTRVVGRT